MPSRGWDFSAKSSSEVRIHADLDSATTSFTGPPTLPPLVPARTLSPVSSNTMNSLNTSQSTDSSYTSRTLNSTIRSVPSEPNQLASSSDTSRRVVSKSDPATSGTMPHSTSASSRSYAAPSQTHMPPPSRQNSIPLQSGLVRSISSEFGPIKSYTSSNNLHHGPEESNGISSPSGPSPNPGTSAQWSSAVGGAQVGKSGRVIERLMAENDMLKRDIKIERLRAEESKQAKRMAEESKQALVAHYEGQAHDATVVKTLLRRRERQVTELTAQIDGYRQKTEQAQESERFYRAAMEKMQVETKQNVDDAQTFAALMEGRNNTLSSHWKEQGAELDRKAGKLRKEIDKVVDDRIADDRRMNMLQSLCDQQNEKLVALEAEKKTISETYEGYRREQDEALRNIKEMARTQEESMEEKLKETTQVLGELKWALGVKKNVRGAE